MKKYTYFASRRSEDWPNPSQLEPYFLAPKGQEWFYTGGNDGASLRAEGLYGTEKLEPKTGRVDVYLLMTGNPQHGVILFYSKWDGRIGRKFGYSSKGDLSRLRELVYSLHGTPLPVGLFVPFPIAWKAVKEFIETDGDLPKSIEWIANSDLPPNTFPDP